MKFKSIPATLIFINLEHLYMMNPINMSLGTFISVEHYMNLKHL